MTSSEPCLAAIVPTRNRPDELRTFLASLREQSLRPDLLIVVDSSDPQIAPRVRSEVERGWPGAYCLEHWPPSAAAQRNRGLEAVTGDCDLVVLLDDDVTLPPEALENACCDIARASPDFIGFGLNPTDEDATRGYGRLRTSRLARWLGLYSDRIGAVMPSGWHTRLVQVEAPAEIEWLSSCAAIWKAAAIRDIRFDEFFEQYSYLEDLDFSLQARSKGRFLALSSACFLHKPAPGGRKSRFWFGRIEIRNRLYIVRKHGLSEVRFWLGVIVRAVLSLAAGLKGQRAEFARLVGNVTEAASLLQRHRRNTFALAQRPQP